MVAICVSDFPTRKTVLNLKVLALVSVASLFLSNAWTQTANSSPIVIGESVELRSKVLNESRTLLISKPTGYDDGTDRYPVLYLLDGETHFQYTSAMVNFLAEDDRMPNMLVVGIDSKDSEHRIHDLTPPSEDVTDNRFHPGNGGAAAFLSFVADELTPFIDKTYRTRPYRVLVGHSLGGLFAIYSLISKPQQFNAYIAADPTINWNKQELVSDTESFLRVTKNLQVDLYLAISGDSADTPSEIRRFTAALEKQSPAGFRWHYERMNDEDHLSIPVPSIYRGLEMIFEDWNLPHPLAVYDRGGLGAIHSRIRDAGKRFGYPERDVPPFTISILVAELMQAGRLDDASKVLLHDPVRYPLPWNQLDALARNYEKQGDTQNAIRYYRMSLEQNPQNEYAKKKLLEKGISLPTAKP